MWRQGLQIAAMPPQSLRFLVMDTQKEFEVRLFDPEDRQILVVPVIAASAAEAQHRAEALQASHQAARHELRGLMRSARYAGATDAFRPDGG
jgi:hypothetical protein